MFLRRLRARWRARVSEAAVHGFGAADARLPLAGVARRLLCKAFPDHWSFLLGEIALYTFAVLVLTGVYLTLFFDPTTGRTPYTGSYPLLRGQLVSRAYASTMALSFDVRGGLLIRQIHHWAALVFVAAVAVHLLRVFFTGAFRKPREANWMVGVSLFLLALLWRASPATRCRTTCCPAPVCGRP